MFKFILPLPIIALMTLGTVATAQDSGTTDAEDKADSLLDLGSPVDGNPQLGERYLREEIDDWNIACIKTDQESDPCSMLQVLTDKQGNPMAEISMFRLENRGQAVAAATVIVPLETLLQAQLTISVDGKPGRRYNYSYCNPIGCFAQIGLTAEDIDSFKKGGTATLELVPAPAPDERVVLTMSLKGFSAAYEVVDVVSKP